MDKEFERYKQFCKQKGLKECDFDSLLTFLNKQKNKTQSKQKGFSSFEDFKKTSVPIEVVLPMTNQDRLEAIEDYYLWADKKNYNLEHAGVFIEYKRYLLKEG